MKRTRSNRIIVLGFSALLLVGCGGESEDTEPNDSEVATSSIGVVPSELNQAAPSREPQSFGDCVFDIDDEDISRIAEYHDLSREDAYVLARDLCGIGADINVYKIAGREDLAIDECRARKLC